MYLKTAFAKVNQKGYVAPPLGLFKPLDDEEKPRIQCIPRDKILDKTLKVSVFRCKSVSYFLHCLVKKQI